MEELLEIKLTHATFKHATLKLISKAFGWRETSKLLLQRIQNLSKRGYSAREMKLLKLILKRDYNDTNVDYDAILYHFPGKAKEDLANM